MEKSHSENIEDAAQIKQEPAEDYEVSSMDSMSKPADSSEVRYYILLGPVILLAWIYFRAALKKLPC